MNPLHCTSLISSLPFQSRIYIHIYIYSTKGNWCELVLYFLLINNEKKFFEKAKKLVLVQLLLFFFPSVSTVFFLLDTGVVCNCVSVTLCLFLSLSLFLLPSPLLGGWKKILPKNFCLSRMQLAHVILVCILHVVLPYPSSSASPFNS